MQSSTEGTQLPGHFLRSLVHTSLLSYIASMLSDGTVRDRYTRRGVFAQLDLATLFDTKTTVRENTKRLAWNNLFGDPSFDISWPHLRVIVTLCRTSQVGYGWRDNGHPDWPG